MTSNITLAKKGDKEALLALIAENELNIYRVARGMLWEKQDIEDAIQNTIIKVITKITTLKKDEYFRTWMIKILINECNMIIRNSKRTLPIDAGLENQQKLDFYKDMDLTNAIHSLGEDLREVTVLFYFEDMQQKDIAKLLNIPEGTVKSRLIRARKVLYKVLEEE